MSLSADAEKFLQVLARLRTPEPWDVPVAQARAAMQLSSPKLPDSPRLGDVSDVRVDTRSGPLVLRVYRPEQIEHAAVTLYFHGGGWVLGSINTHDEMVRRLTAAAGSVFVSVDYRLAPEHPYPAALDDAFAALQWAHSRRAELTGADRSSLIVAGDSAGANLAAALCLRSRDQHGPEIDLQLLLYPITDCDFDRPSYRENAEGYFLTRAQMQWYWDQYAPAPIDRTHGYLSPLRAESLSGLPPAYIITAGFDPLRDEGEAYADQLYEAGVAASLHRYPGEIHGFVKRFEQFAAGREAIRELGEVIRRSTRRLS